MHNKLLRVLVVEDHADIRLVVGMFLESLGHQAEFAVDAGSALAITCQRTFDVLLTDVGLPGRDGWELVRAMNARGCLPPLVISMSASNTGQEPAQSRAAGCRVHLLKPFKPLELANALQMPPSPPERTGAAKKP